MLYLKNLILKFIFVCFLIFGLVLVTSFPLTARANEKIDYNLPFQNGLSVRVTQACIDGFSAPNCIHSGLFSKRYSVDFSCFADTFDILAIASGTVASFGFDQYGYGHYVVINHTNGETALYAHLYQPPFAKSGKVFKGQKLGLCGNTGNSTGRHLHIELRPNSTTQNTTPIFFKECQKGNCVSNQLVVSRSYTSDNIIYSSALNFNSPEYKNNECFTNLQVKNFDEYQAFQDQKNCLLENGFLNTLDSNSALIYNTSLKFDKSRNLEESSYCKQLINFQGYEIGQTNHIIERLQICLINLGVLKIEKATGYYGNLTRNAQIEVQKSYNN
jgi:murein DD-endopeptidase MepM/ murein hydrolase activator NlpD